MEGQKLERFINSFITGKCEDVLKEFPENSIDLIVTSPPYSDQRFYGTDESRIHPDDYVEWFLTKAIEFKRVLKETGSFILNINDKVVEGKQHLYVFELVLKLVKEIGFNFVRDYIWFNPSTPPNIFSTGKYGRTKKSHEYCFWFSKGDTWTFNLSPIRKPYSKSMLKTFEEQKAFSDNRIKKPSGHSFNIKRWRNKGGSDPGSVLTIPNTISNDKFNKMCRNRGIAHPARFPEKLVEFFILAGSNENDIVLDPFCGSGTTAVSAHRHKRRWIGIDANKDYCELAYDRMKLEFPDEYEQMRLI